MLSEEEKTYLQVPSQEMEPVKAFFLNAIQAKSSVSLFNFTQKDTLKRVAGKLEMSRT